MEELAAPWGACLPDKQLMDGRFSQGKPPAPVSGVQAAGGLQGAESGSGACLMLHSVSDRPEQPVVGAHSFWPQK